MKGSLLASLAVASLVSFVSSGAVNDSRLTFSTRGPDTYADGTPVRDGECYALVWSARGAFGGFTSDGAAAAAAAAAADRVLLVAPLAKGGRCPLTLFQLAAEETPSGGAFEVWLLDTRITAADGSVTVARGVAESGRPAVVNGAAGCTAAGAVTVAAGGADFAAVAGAADDGDAAVGRRCRARDLDGGRRRGT